MKESEEKDNLFCRVDFEVLESLGCKDLVTRNFQREDEPLESRS